LKKNPQVILGIDPGLANIGLGLIKVDSGRSHYLHHFVLRTPSDQPLVQRLLSIQQGIERIVHQFHPEAASIETLYFAKNVKSALPVSEARGAIILSLALLGIPVFEFTPLQIKQSVVGVGRGDKNQVKQMVQLILGLQSLEGADHGFDALAAAITLQHFGIPAL